jgi:xanthine dehydrogenase YagS FAD-binding subunit
MNNFEYASPTTESELLSHLRDFPGETELLAGGTDLVGLMQKMVITPRRVVNLLDVPNFRDVEELDGGVVAIGATVTLDIVLVHPYLNPYPGLRHAVDGISSMQIQCQGTIGGEVLQRPQCWFFRDNRGLLAAGGKMAEQGENRYHAIFNNHRAAKFVSASRLAPALIALGAKARLIGPGDFDEQIVPLESLFRTPRHEGERENTLRPGQVLTHLLLPPAEGIANATYEVRQGEGPEYPLASAAAALGIEGGIVREAKIVLGQVAPTPLVSVEAAAALIGREVNADTAHAAGRAAVASATPLSNNEYKVDLSAVAVKRAILRAAGIETGGF